MQLKFKQVPLVEIYEQMKPLLKEHYDEVAHYKHIPLEPDMDSYYNIERQGALITFGVFDEEDNNKLVGYSLYFKKNNIHYKSSCQAVQDVIFITKAYRGGTGMAFINWCDIKLKELGIEVVYHHVKAKEGLNFGPMLEQQGYELVDLIYTKRL